MPMPQRSGVLMGGGDSAASARSSDSGT